MKTTSGTAMELFHRTWPLFKVLVVMYSTAVATLWATIRALAPEGQAFSPWRGVIVAMAMTFVGNSFSEVLSPFLGHWAVLVKIAMEVLIVKINFPLSLGRSLLAGLIYFGAVTGVYYLYVHLAGPVAMPAHLHAHK